MIAQVLPPRDLWPRKAVFGWRMRMLREALGLTQTDAADPCTGSAGGQRFRTVGTPGGDTGAER